MQQQRVKLLHPLWNVAALVAIASLTLLPGNVKAQVGNGLGKPVQTASGTDATTEVVINNYSFNPASLTVKVGTTVTWNNQDDDPHTVDSTQGKFKSPTLNKGNSFKFRFTEAGEYPFFCRFHPKMTGKVVVQR